VHSDSAKQKEHTRGTTIERRPSQRYVPRASHLERQKLRQDMRNQASTQPSVSTYIPSTNPTNSSTSCNVQPLSEASATLSRSVPQISSNKREDNGSTTKGHSTSFSASTEAQGQRPTTSSIPIFGKFRAQARRYCVLYAEKHKSVARTNQAKPHITRIKIDRQIEEKSSAAAGQHNGSESGNSISGRRVSTKIPKYTPSKSDVSYRLRCAQRFLTSVMSFCFADSVRSLLECSVPL